MVMSERSLFIDANIYLEFYSEHTSDLAKLLETLLAVKDHIFVTKQVVNEVQRRKQDVFASSLSAHVKNFKLRSVHLPTHFDKRGESGGTDWDNDFKDLSVKFKDLQRKERATAERILERISTSQDSVSLKLSDVFTLAEEADEDQLLRARNRRERGNPPGFKRDPLGDQISWEQYLDNIHGLEEVWIVSRDGDFGIEGEDKCYLNPFLLKEIQNLCGEMVAVHFFWTLSDGLKENILKKIFKEEKSIPAGATGSTGPISTTGMPGTSYPVSSSVSFQGSNLSGGIPDGHTGSSLGYPISMLMRCANCGNQFSVDLRRGILKTLRPSYSCPVCGTQADAIEFSF
jgi:DNA-directed RNA polymerase subunit RPC12/RpoP